MTICTLNGKTAEAIIDVKWHRYIFKPNELYGSITLDGTEYVSVNKIAGWGGYGENFFERLSSKLQNEVHIPTFVIPQKNPIYLHDHMSMISFWGENFDYIFLSEIEVDKPQYDYYGPAKSIEEAQMVLENIKSIHNIQ